MNVDLEQKVRTIIPRWRDFRTTLALGELEPVGLRSVDSPAPSSEDVADQLRDWQSHRSLAFATDLVGAAFVLGIEESIEEAADFILSEDSESTDLQKRIATQALRPSFKPNPANQVESLGDSNTIINLSRANVRRYRQELLRSFRNPVLLVELAREYATLGAIKKAVRAMDMAVALSPANRYVLRSAARLYVHHDEIEKAHSVLKRAPSLTMDPWLLAAEIAIASMRDLTSRHITRGVRQIEDANFSPFDLSELTSAIATVEMQNAKNRKARTLFRKALRRPTDNSVAQVEWASRQMLNLEVDVRQLDVPRNFEAPARHLYQNGDLEAAIEFGKSWILDQPFAAMPVGFTGSAASLLEKYEIAQQVYEFGLRANPDNPTLRNNLAFSLASTSQPDLAEDELDRIDRSSLDLEGRIVTTATQGLIRFRQGHLDEGRTLYMKSIELASTNDKKAYVMRALLFLAREEILARTPLATKALEAAEAEASKFQPNVELRMLLPRLKKKIESSS
jgi:tetratricopeptide (TPR) repeat protein